MISREALMEKKGRVANEKAMNEQRTQSPNSGKASQKIAPALPPSAFSSICVSRVVVCCFASVMLGSLFSTPFCVILK